MLGEKIGESTGKITGQRTLPSDHEGPKVETSFQSAGKILGVEFTELGTYCTALREGGVLYGEGQGVLMSKDGESCTWRGAGIGRPTGKGLGVSYRGSL